VSRDGSLRVDVSRGATALPSEPTGAVPRETGGISAMGKPDSGEIPGFAGETLSPSGRLRSEAGAFESGGVAVFRTERPGMLERMSGAAPGDGTVEPRWPAAAPEIVPFGFTPVADGTFDVAPVAADAEVEPAAEADVPADAPELAPPPAPDPPPPAPPAPPPPACAKRGPSATVLQIPAIKRMGFEFMAW
jgi:hypothetical protein